MRNLTVFALNQAPLIGGRGVLLIDDIYDSGATVTYLTRLLRERGASLVAVLAFGHTSISLLLAPGDLA